MKQAFQSLKNGAIELVELPAPRVDSNSLLIKTELSLISSGTEKMLIDFGKSNLIEKALNNRDRVRDVLQKVKTEGVSSVYQKISSKLEEPIPIGYCNVGIVKEIGSEVSGFRIGDRVVSNGPHAEIVVVNKNLCSKIPDSVSNDDAVYTVLASVALHSIRLSKSQIGESYLIIGLGLVGLIATKILLLSGCQVICADYDSKRLDIASNIGAMTINPSDFESIEEGIDAIGLKDSIDAAIIATSGNSTEPINQASKVLRKRGRIILVGTADIKLSRDIFYHKELSFMVSCSYGPGRYDPFYEIHGQDYPIEYVRWTENRNFQTLLSLMQKRSLKTSHLSTDRFKFSDIKEAYNRLLDDSGSLGIILEYPKKIDSKSNYKIKNQSISKKQESVVIDFVGTGNFARSVLIPSFSKTKSSFNKALSSSGINATGLEKKYDFREVTTDERDIFKSSSSNCVIISTRHNTHADFLQKAIKSNKNVYIEKPLCINKDEFSQLVSFLNEYKKNLPIIFMGFNRRFASLIAEVKSHLSKVNHPLHINYFINAGPIDSNNWIHDSKIGGGRLIGEACHFIDLVLYLVGSDIVDYSIKSFDTNTKDSFVISLQFSDSSIANINYLAFGPKQISKEFIRITYPNSLIEIDNFKNLRTINTKSLKSKKLLKQDKGHLAAATSFVKSVHEGSESPTPLEDILKVSQITIDLS